MNKADVSKLMSQLKIAVAPSPRRIKNPDGSDGRLMKMRKTVTALFKFERLELHFNRADEARGYAERLISDAIRNGDKHKPTMEMADYWLLDKAVVHKLFKVICPRFENSNYSATRMYPAPREYPCTDHNKRYRARSVLELRGHPYPPVLPDTRNRNFLHNVLLDAAKKDFYYRKTKEAHEASADAASKNEDIVTK